MKNRNRLAVLGMSAVLTFALAKVCLASAYNPVIYGSCCMAGAWDPIQQSCIGENGKHGALTLCADDVPYASSPTHIRGYVCDEDGGLHWGTTVFSGFAFLDPNSPGDPCPAP